MKNKISTKAYALSAKSKLAGTYFKQANQLASTIYSSFIGFEKRLGNRKTYTQLVQLLIKVYYSDREHDEQDRLLCCGDIELLKNWHFNKSREWHSNYDLHVDFSTLINSQKTEVKLNISANKLRCSQEEVKGIFINYYVFSIDEDSQETEVQQAEDLAINIGDDYGPLSSDFEFYKVNNGFIMVIGVVKAKFRAKSDDEIYVSLNQHYYKAAVSYCVGICDGEIKTYKTQKTINEPVLNVTAKVPWKNI